MHEKKYCTPFLPVELRGLYVAESVRVVGGQEEGVRGDELVVLHADHVADLGEKKNVTAHVTMIGQKRSAQDFEKRDHSKSYARSMLFKTLFRALEVNDCHVHCYKKLTVGRQFNLEITELDF